MLDTNHQGTMVKVVLLFNSRNTILRSFKSILFLTDPNQFPSTIVVTDQLHFCIEKLTYYEGIFPRKMVQVGRLSFLLKLSYITKVTIHPDMFITLDN